MRRAGCATLSTGLRRGLPFRRELVAEDRLMDERLGRRHRKDHGGTRTKDRPRSALGYRAGAASMGPRTAMRLHVKP